MNKREPQSVNCALPVRLIGADDVWPQVSLITTQPEDGAATGNRHSGRWTVLWIATD